MRRQLAGKQAPLLTAAAESRGDDRQSTEEFRTERRGGAGQVEGGGERGQNEPEVAAVCGGNDGRLLSVTMWGEVIQVYLLKARPPPLNQRKNSRWFVGFSAVLLQLSATFTVCLSGLSD